MWKKVDMVNWLADKIIGKPSLFVKRLGRNGEIEVIRARLIRKQTMHLLDITGNPSIIRRFDCDEQKWLLVLASRYQK